MQKLKKFEKWKNLFCGRSNHKVNVEHRPPNLETSEEMSLEQAVENLYRYEKQANDRLISGEEYIIPYNRAVRVDAIPQTEQWTFKKIHPNFIFKVFPWDEYSLMDENNEVFKISPKDFNVNWVLVKKDI